MPFSIWKEPPRHPLWASPSEPPPPSRSINTTAEVSRWNGTPANLWISIVSSEGAQETSHDGFSEVYISTQYVSWPVGDTVGAFDASVVPSKWVDHVTSPEYLIFEAVLTMSLRLTP